MHFEGVKKKRVLCFGDSITQGYMVELTKAWPWIITELSGYTVEALNYGISGDTTLDGLHRLRSAMETAPDIAVVELGINDFFSLVPLEQAEVNLSIIIKKFRETGADVLLAGFVMPGGRPWEEMYRRLAEREKVRLYPDIFKGLKDDAGNFDKRFFFSDGVHPNESGYEIIADNVYKAIQGCRSR